MKGQLRIDELYVFVALDKDGTEGVPAFLDPVTGTYFPMVGADKERVDSFRAMAQLMVDQVGGPSIKLVRFSVREEVEEIKKTRAAPAQTADQK